MPTAGQEKMQAAVWPAFPASFRPEAAGFVSLVAQLPEERPGIPSFRGAMYALSASQSQRHGKLGVWSIVGNSGGNPQREEVVCWPLAMRLRVLQGGMVRVCTDEA